MFAIEAMEILMKQERKLQYFHVALLQLLDWDLVGSDDLIGETKVLYFLD